MALQLPNQHDFQFSSVSVGDIIYRRDANYWANLHAGTTGQVLTAHGAGVAPSWADAGGGGDLSTAVILAPNSVSRNLIQPTADANSGLLVQEHSATHSAELLGVLMAGGGSYFAVFNPAAGSGVAQISSPNGVDTTLLGVTTGNGQSIFNVATFTSFDVSENYLGECYIRPDCSLQFWHPTTAAGNDRVSGRLAHGMLDNTHATWKGRLFLTAVDSNGERTFLTGEADGAAPRIGFLGATAVARQLLATGASHTVDDVITVLQTLGLCKQS
jgi:hypothetical protein